MAMKRTRRKADTVSQMENGSQIEMLFEKKRGCLVWHPHEVWGEIYLKSCKNREKSRALGGKGMECS